MITILGRDIPNRVDEMTIEQFELITEISNNQNIDPIDRHLQIFVALGIPEKEFFDFDVADFIDIVKEFNDGNKMAELSDPVTTLELDGYAYSAEFKLTVRETKLIEKIAITKPKGYISDILAVMFKRDDLTNAEHYAEAHLKLKAKLIKGLTADIAIPYLMFIANKIKAQVPEADESIITEEVE
jgi:hypothetical protein